MHSIILDASPILTNEPSISTLLAKAEKVYTIPQVISEIRDRNARIRLEATVIPFLTIRSPSLPSIKAVNDFARRTGDLTVLSKADIQILALAYELECELNHGDWRLRRLPGQKELNGPLPIKIAKVASQPGIPDGTNLVSDPATIGVPEHSSEVDAETPTDTFPEEQPVTVAADLLMPRDYLETLDPAMAALTTHTQPSDHSEVVDIHLAADRMIAGAPSDPESDADDSEGWITPANIKKRQAKEHNEAATPIAKPKMMQVATITNDYAMQNVLLQMNLNLLSASMLRVRHLKTYILRCHACFERTKDMTKQFCPRCGKPTLTRVACSTNANGEFKIHLKKNMQWNSRGDRFSIPKPVSGTANGKVGAGKGGGKGGWGQELILAEDQKEYLQALTGQRRGKERDLMDDDYLPGILTGERGRAGGRPKVGAGKNVNSRKR